jgi:O-antigen ligase
VLWLIIGASVWFLVNALFGTQWDVVKSWQFAGIIERMPQVEIASTPFIFFIHPNLISMVIAYLLPLLAGVTLYAAAHRWMRVLSMLLIAAFAAVLALAQARFVIVALLTGMLVWVWFALRGRRWRSALLTLLVTLGIGEILLVSQINVPQSAPDAVAMRQRDGESMNGRLIIWQKAFTLIRAYPITGVGMNMFDSQRVRDDYPMEFWGTNRTYHAHQAYLQTWVDFGVIGLAAFGLIYAAMAAMLLSVWKTAAHGSRVLALSAAVSLLTLLAVGFVDVMVLWDRVSVVFWLTLAVGGALYSARRSPSPVTLSTQKLIKH